MGRARSLVRTVRFVITDTFKSRSGAAAVPGRREFYDEATGMRGGLGRGTAAKLDEQSEQGLRPDAGDRGLS